MRACAALLILDYTHITNFHFLRLYAYYTHFIDYAQVDNISSI